MILVIYFSFLKFVRKEVAAWKKFRDNKMGMIPAGQKVAVYGGRDAFVLSGGIVTWQAAGMPVVS